ncbi:MAG TPA: glycosyltransferase [Thermoanaerobaculia bacterium]|nr:glycosyltransferase [Thermoanaerobaculia bacterium]
MKLLLVSTSAGAGHTRAAQALEETARLRFPEVAVRHVDILDFVDRAYRKAYAGGYLAMVDRAPELWGHLYKASDRVPREGLRKKLVRAFDRLEFAGFRAFVKDFAPDVLLATHFLAAQVFPPRERRKIPFRFGLVVTDFDVHAFWVQPDADVTCVATEELRAILAGRGVDERRIEVTGIPIMPAFAARHDRRRLRAAFGIAEGMQAVLVLGGGSGVGSMREAVEAALAAGRVHVLAVAGRNAALEKSLREVDVPKGAALSVFGFVTNMDDLMAAADIAVTKSGGLTTAECLASALPMVVRGPIPGQEERNCDFVLEAGAGVRANGSDSLRIKLESLLSSAARLARMKEAARAAGKPRAAEEILSFMLRR